MLRQVSLQTGAEWGICFELIMKRDRIMLYQNKIVFLTAALLLVFVSYPGVLAAKEAEPRQQGQPFIYIPQMNYNFGEKMESAELELEFAVKNTGAGVLNISQVKTS